MSYDEMIDKAAAEMAAALCANPCSSSITLWSVGTNREWDGFLTVGEEAPDMPQGRWARNIRPSENNASGYQTWNTVPYSELRHIIAQACRREPILPIERPADFIVRSSYADIHVNRTSGTIIRIDYAAMGGTNQWDDVERFDPATLVGDEMDCLDVGFWTKDGAYDAPRALEAPCLADAV